MTNELLTPILLHVTADQDQQSAVLDVIAQQGMANVIDRTFLNTEQETISIEMVRDLITNLSYATQNNARLVVLLHAEQLSLPAQQAMLKTLEEPPARTLIVLVTEQPGALLPTIQSRCLLIVSSSAPPLAGGPGLPEVMINLLENPGSAGMSECIDLAEQYKDRGEAITLITQAIHWAHQNKKTASLPTLINCLENLQKNANVQLTLEHCFFTIHRTALR